LWEIAQQFSVGEASVNRWVRLFRRTGSVAPKPAAGGQPSKLDGEHLEAVHILVLEKPDIIEREIKHALDVIHQIQVSRSAVNRALHRLDLSRKKRLLSLPNARVFESPNFDASIKKKFPSLI
jgi:transposase